MLQETLKIRSQHQKEFCAFSEVTRSYQKVGCAQTSVSHSSVEAEVISLDAGLRLDGIPALDLWDLVIEVFHSTPNQINKNQRCKRATGKPVGKYSTKHAKTDSNHEHQSRSDQY